MEELTTVKTGDVILPTRSIDGSAGPHLMIRCVTRPDPHTDVLLNRLGIDLPRQLKRQRLALAAPDNAACAM